MRIDKGKGNHVVCFVRGCQISARIIYVDGDVWIVVWMLRMFLFAQFVDAWIDLHCINCFGAVPEGGSNATAAAGTKYENAIECWLGGKRQVAAGKFDGLDQLRMFFQICIREIHDALEEDMVDVDVCPPLEGWLGLVWLHHEWCRIDTVIRCPDASLRVVKRKPNGQGEGGDLLWSAQEDNQRARAKAQPDRGRCAYCAKQRVSDDATKTAGKIDRVASQWLMLGHFQTKLRAERIENADDEKKNAQQNDGVGAQLHGRCYSGVRGDPVSDISGDEKIQISQPQLRCGGKNAAEEGEKIGENFEELGVASIGRASLRGHGATDTHADNRRHQD